MTSQPTGTTPAPSALPLNITSLIRLVFGLAAGYLGQGAWASGNVGQAVLAAVLAVATVLWIVFKNSNIISTLIAALTAPAKTVITPAGAVKAPASTIVSLLVIGVLAAGALPFLTGCAQPGQLSVIQVAEKADTAALTLYATVGNVVSTWEIARPQDTTAAEKIRSKAWSDLMLIDQAYKLGQAIDLSALTNDLSAAQKASGVSPAAALEMRRKLAVLS